MESLQSEGQNYMSVSCIGYHLPIWVHLQYCKESFGANTIHQQSSYCVKMEGLFETHGAIFHLVPECCSFAHL